MGVMEHDVEVGLKRSATSPSSMLDKFLMIMGEVDICIRPALLPPIIHMILVYHLIFIVMVITEVDIGLIPENILHITMVN